VSDSPLVLVAEDDADLQDFLRDTLEMDGMRVVVASDGAGALLEAGQSAPDIVLLDLDLPDLDGLEVLTALRRARPVPVIVLTGRRGEADRITGLERGADDYVVKPFSAKELVARIHAVLRRVPPADAAQPFAEAGIIEREGLRIDTEAREVEVRGAPVELTKREFDLLAFLAAHPRKVFTRSELLQQVWGSSEQWQVPATVTEHVRRIRLKIEEDPADPRFVQNVRGVGYRFTG
jgi:two-component system phosphate regulon response regulator PhoB